MRREWITKEGGRCLTLFFNGWGMDERAVQHLAGTGDVLMFYDYRDITGEEAPETAGYEEVRVVAWSLGEWAASVLLSRWALPADYRVAINGTERPVDECYGIQPKVYLLTERGMDERGRNKFFARMLAGREEMVKFEVNKPRRELNEQVEELQAIREQSGLIRPEMQWNKTYVFAGDVIFPAENQRNWWNGRCEVVNLEGGHYPFYVLDNWEVI